MGDTIETAQHFIFVTQVYFCYAVVLWDWIISLHREWRFIWKSQWTPVKAAYLFCRYWVIVTVPYLLYCFVGNHSFETCQRIFKIPVALAMWNQHIVVLLIRTYAFFNRNRYLLCFLTSALCGVVAYQLYVDISQMDLLPFVTPPFTSGPCFPMSIPHSAHLLGKIAPLLFDTLVTSVTVWKAITIRRRSGISSSRLIQTFLREGVFYYLLISIANLINGIFYLQPRQVISAINIPLSVMMSPLLACRLILDLRERGSETVAQSTLGAFAAYSPTSPSNKSTKTSSPITRSKGSPAPGLTGFRFVTGSGPATYKAEVVLGDVVAGGPGQGELDGVELENVNFNALVGARGSYMAGDEEDIDALYLGEKMQVESAPVFRSFDIEDGVRGIRVDVETMSTSI
ncbi:hypothetical protein JAAARDRAFT_120933 [Jaapia argillacea MUCL 33604]|uniref:DUF6533 domain-containing protein n=1 Tax=Jaapia argillacea MUCL 33604 TaxID=933084 RepID=A0A067QKS3_9AGAM|nr:hypothetical protein JAAARDRAFT_120933 [Jaapia argillacea MUCL 33604]